jgi:hypothetical protein
VSKLYEKILKGAFFLPKYLSAEVKDLLLKMIETSPRRRVPLRELK